MNTPLRKGTLPPLGVPLELKTRLRNPTTARLDAIVIADLFGISRTDIARLCGVSTQSINQNSSSSDIEAKLQPLEDVAKVIHWCGGSESKFRSWLNCPNRDFPDVDGRKPTPLDLILLGHLELVVQKVYNLRTGHPS